MTQTNWQFCTHLVPLARALGDTTGAVLEVGMGDASTPWLSMYCWAAQRRLVSVDRHADWVAKFADQPWGERRVIDYDKDLPELAKEPWSVVLVDHWPGGRRAKDALRFRTAAEIVLVHDYLQLQESLHSITANWRTASVSNDTLVLRQ